MKVELHPHQEKAVGEMHNGCILCGEVGTGKTITALAYALLKEAGKDIYVITTAKKRDSGDWEREAAMLAVPFDGIKVDSWNNISKYIDVENAFFIFDEQRLVGTGTWVQSFYKIAKHNRWVLLSATPGDSWLDYVPVFIANGFYKNITEFRQEHVIYSRYSKFPKVDRYINPGLLQRRRKLLLVEMPIIRHTTRNIEMVEVDYDTEMLNTVWKKRWHVFEDRPLRDAGEMFRVGRKVVAQHPSRLAKVRELMEKHPRLIVFYNFNYELEELRTLGDESKWKKTGRMSDSYPAKGMISTTDLSSNSHPGRGGGSSTPAAEGPSDSLLAERDRGGFALAEWNGHKHEAVPETDRWVYLVQYTAGAEGWNCITTDAMVFYSLTYSYKQFIQAEGRIDRLNTPFSDLFYYVLITKSVVDKAVWRALRTKKDFNVRAFKW